MIGFRNLNLKVLRTLEEYFNTKFSTNISTSTMAHRISGTNSFSCEIGHSGKDLITIFQEFSSSIDKAFILAGGLGTRLSFYGV